jgi:hypothetical protein
MLQKLQKREETEGRIKYTRVKSFITSNLISPTGGMLYGKNGLYTEYTLDPGKGTVYGKIMDYIRNI